NSTFSGTSALVSATNASPSITGCTFSGLNQAISLTGLTNSAIGQNMFVGDGTAISIGGPDSRSEVLSNVFTGNTYSLAFATADALFSAFPASFDTNEFMGQAGQDVVNIPGSISVSGTVPASPVPYFSYGLSIPLGTTLVAPPGIVFQLAAGYPVTV